MDVSLNPANFRRTPIELMVVPLPSPLITPPGRMKYFIQNANSQAKYIFTCNYCNGNKNKKKHNTE